MEVKCQLNTSTVKQGIKVKMSGDNLQNKSNCQIRWPNHFTENNVDTVENHVKWICDFTTLIFYQSCVSKISFDQVSCAYRLDCSIIEIIVS